MRPQASYIVWHDSRPAAYVALSGKIHQPGCRYYVAPQSEVSIARVEPGPEFWDRCCAVCFRGEQSAFEADEAHEAPVPAVASAPEALVAPQALQIDQAPSAPETATAPISSRVRRKQRRAATFIARPRRLSRPQALAFIAVVGGLILLVAVSGILHW